MMLHPPRTKRAACPVAPDRHRLVHQFFALLEQQGVPLAEVAGRAGYGFTTLKEWRHGKTPSIASLEAALNVLGRSIVAAEHLEQAELPRLAAARGRAAPAPRGHPAVRAFFALLDASGKSLHGVHTRAGVSGSCARWRTSTCPRVDFLDACLQTLGWHLVIVPLAEADEAPVPRRTWPVAQAAALLMRSSTSLTKRRRLPGAPGGHANRQIRRRI